MDGAFLLLLTGPPGAGKTTVGRLVAARFSRSVCIQADWFWTTVVNGHVPPWEPAADDQNQVMIRSALATAVRTANGGYATVLEGIIGPWHFDLVRQELATCAAPVTFAVLRPPIGVCLDRAVGRVAEGPEHHDALTQEGPIRHLWDQFADLGRLDRHVLDTAGLDAMGTAEVVCARLRDGSLAGALSAT